MGSESSLLLVLWVPPDNSIVVNLAQFVLTVIEGQLFATRSYTIHYPPKHFQALLCELVLHLDYIFLILPSLSISLQFSSLLKISKNNTWL
jgi:hypothetical protein